MMKRPTLSASILLSVVFGAVIGLFLGEYAGVVSIIGDAFVGLLQMTVLPYITVALIANIGRLSPTESRRFVATAGAFLLISFALALAAIVLMPLAFPPRESAAFFSTSLLEEPAKVDFLKLFIPSNPFYALANNIVPAVVLFCMAIGIAIITLKNKAMALEHLDFLTSALARINHYMIKLTPVGVFAIVASTTGTMSFDELEKMKVYLLVYTVAVLILAFGVLPLLMASVTPFSYREIFSAFRTPVLTAFATGKVFIVLPMIVESAEELFKKHHPEPDKPVSNVRAVTPLIYPFPHAGKLLSLMFIPFAAWFVDDPVRLTEFPAMLMAGVFSMFGSPVAAMPFLLDMQRLPADMFHLFLVTGVYASRLGDMLGAVHLLFVSVLTASFLNKGLRVRPRKLLGSFAFIFILSAAVIGGTRTYLGASSESRYDKADVVQRMHTAVHSTSSVVHRAVPAPRADTTSSASAIELIKETGVLRVGYHPDNLPMSFFNADDELVGFDVDMAQLLARHLGCTLEFVPFEHARLADQLETGDFDVAMSGIGVLPNRLAGMRFTAPYLQVAVALLVRDHRREEFAARIEERDFEGVRVGFARLDDASAIAAELLPGAELVEVATVRSYFESGGQGLDALVFAAEPGAAWTLLYPDFSVVVVRPLFQVPVAYAVARQEEEFAAFLDSWLTIVDAGRLYDRLYEHWILGQNAEKGGPRWSVIRNVLHWVD
jgi:Na+/H+-dicarboxylate symporter